MKLLHVSENVGNLSSKDSTCFSTDINYKKRSLSYTSLHGFHLLHYCTLEFLYMENYFWSTSSSAHDNHCVSYLLRVTSQSLPSVTTTTFGITFLDGIYVMV